MEHYYTEKPTSKYLESEIKISLNEDVFYINSASGVFARGGLDSASKLLIESANLPESGDILDLGCGYGVIGLAVLRKKNEYNVTFSDVNERALNLVRNNLKKLKLRGKVIKSDGFEKIKKSFDCILLNPPMAAGRKTCFKLIEDSYNHLNSNGTLQIVARHNKGGKVLQEKMNEVYGKTEVLSKKSGFRVYMAKK